MISLNYEIGSAMMDTRMNISFDWTKRLPYTNAAVGHPDEDVGRALFRPNATLIDSQPVELQDQHHPRTGRIHRDLKAQRDA